MPGWGELAKPMILRDTRAREHARDVYRGRRRWTQSMSLGPPHPATTPLEIPHTLLATSRPARPLDQRIGIKIST